MGNKSTRRRTRQSLGQQTKRGSTSFRSKSYLSHGISTTSSTSGVPRDNLSLRPVFIDPEILACFNDYPERYRKIKGFTNSLWARGPKSVDVRRPFLRGLSAVDGRWAVAHPRTGELVIRFHDHINAMAWIVTANRRVRRWVRLEWYYLVDLYPSV